MSLFKLPNIATAPFCPSEVRGSVHISEISPWWQRVIKTAGPGLLIAVGYMDPGNWATDIEAGSRYGYALLWVVLLSSLSAMLLQTLSLRLGLVSQMDLAQACRRRYSSEKNKILWLMAEISIIACDLAEVLGSALALHLLFGISLLAGVMITAFDTVIVLGLQGKGFRKVEAIVLGLITTIGVCFAFELLMVGPDWTAAVQGLIPRHQSLQSSHALLLAIGILGATVMPHNLYLHSSIVQTRQVSRDTSQLKEVIRLSTWDTIISLSLALLVNAAILILAASAFHSSGHNDVSEIQDAYHLLDPLVGGALASILFGLALLASGQSSTLTGTIAGQILLEGFMDLKIPCWQRRLITRALALVPAFFGVLVLGENGVGTLLVASQVVLSFQLPFAIWPLIRFTSDKNVMGDFANNIIVKITAWCIFILISFANIYLLSRFIVES